MTEEKAIYWTNVKVTLGALKPWGGNPKTSTKADARDLLRSWDELGQFQTIAISPNNDVYDGHQRLSALLTVYGAGYEVDARQSSRLLTDAERRKIAIYSRQIGAWDWDILSGWNAPELMELGFDGDLLKTWKRDTAALDNFLKSEQGETRDAEPQVDRAAELNEKWQVKTGDLWQIGEHRLLCGDSTKREDVERVMGGEKAGACFTSPPYNTGGAQDSGTGGYKNSPMGRTDREVIYNEFPDDMESEKYINFLLSVFSSFSEFAESDCSLLWNVCYNANSRFEYGKVVFSEKNPFQVRETIIWDKTVGMNISTKGILSRTCEFIFLMCKGKKYFTNQGEHDTWWNVWRINNHGGENQKHGHGASFPVELPAEGIKRFSSEGSVVYEPFAGSGTTLVACQNLSRRCRAIEISPAYCAVILERMSQAFPELEIKRLI